MPLPMVADNKIAEHSEIVFFTGQSAVEMTRITGKQSH